MSFASGAAQEAVDDTFDEFGRSAVYTAPGGGSPEPCVIVIDFRDVNARPDDGHPVAGQITIEVRRTDLAAPVQEGVFDFDAGTFEIMNRPMISDEEGLVLRMWAVAA